MAALQLRAAKQICDEVPQGVVSSSGGGGTGPGSTGNTGDAAKKGTSEDDGDDTTFGFSREQWML